MSQVGSLGPQVVRKVVTLERRRTVLKANIDKYAGQYAGEEERSQGIDVATRRPDNCFSLRPHCGTAAIVISPCYDRAWRVVLALARSSLSELGDRGRRVVLGSSSRRAKVDRARSSGASGYRQAR